MSPVLVSALTSAVVALGVEWLAKPQLEARKERILARYRAMAEVKRLLASIMLDASTLSSARMPSGLNEERRRAWRDEYQRISERVVTMTRSLEEALLLVAPFTRDRIRTVLGHYVGYARGIALSDRTWGDKGEILVECTGPLLDVFGTPSQGWLYKARLLHRAHQLQLAEAKILPQDSG
jgi:hypothetical protein